MRLFTHPGVCALTAAVLSVAVIFSCQADAQSPQPSPAGKHRPQKQLSKEQLPGEHLSREQARRFPLELEVLAANAHLMVLPNTPERQKRGLHIRIASALGSLRFLARQYLHATQQSDTSLLEKIDSLRHAFDADELQRLAEESRELAQRYPVKLHGLRPADARPQDITAGRRIYHQLCMACHTHPDTTQAIAAQNLFTMARTLPLREFIARLIAGVHGTPAVALRNPFSDAEIAGLAAYLKQKKAAQ